MSFVSFKIGEPGDRIGSLKIYWGERAIALRAPFTTFAEPIQATELKNIATKALAYIAAFFGFGVVSSVLIDGEYKTFWCDKSISQTWETSTSAKVETLFGRIICEEIQGK